MCVKSGGQRAETTRRFVWRMRTKGPGMSTRARACTSQQTNDPQPAMAPDCPVQAPPPTSQTERARAGQETQRGDMANTKVLVHTNLMRILHELLAQGARLGGHGRAEHHDLGAAGERAICCARQCWRGTVVPHVAQQRPGWHPMQRCSLTTLSTVRPPANHPPSHHDPTPLTPSCPIPPQPADTPCTGVP